MCVHHLGIIRNVEWSLRISLEFEEGLSNLNKMLSDLRCTYLDSKRPEPGVTPGVLLQHCLDEPPEPPKERGYLGAKRSPPV